MNTAKRIATIATATIITIGATATIASADNGHDWNGTKWNGQKWDGGSISSGPAPGTGGLILRDINGRDLGSGIGEAQNFGFNACGPAGSGLIKVVQLKRGGGGGWGNLYSGFVKKAYTQIPGMFPCN